MIKKIYYLTILLLIFGCQSNNGKIELAVIKANPHPFLVDHSRFLLVKDDDKEIKRIKLIPEMGSGQTTIVVESPDKFTVIDCNGFWYEIMKKNGKVLDLGWKWLTPIPKGKIRKYKYNKNIGKHDYIILNDVKLSEVYQIKDPEKP